MTAECHFDNGACIPTRVHTVVVSVQHSEKVKWALISRLCKQPKILIYINLSSEYLMFLPLAYRLRKNTVFLNHMFLVCVQRSLYITILVITWIYYRCLLITWGQRLWRRSSRLPSPRDTSVSKTFNNNKIRKISRCTTGHLFVR